MQDWSNKTEHGDYDTAINVIGGLRDCSIILEAIEYHLSRPGSLKEIFNQRNEFNLRTEKSRTRIEREVRKAFLEFLNENHRELIHGIFDSQVPIKDKEMVLIWHFALNNRLFREITLEVFLKTYYSGRASISKEDVIAFLKELLLQSKDLRISWSEATISTISTKYLNFMTKLGFLSSGRVKSFRQIRPSLEAQVLFQYFIKVYSPDTPNILNNEILPIGFVPVEDLHNRLKKLSLKSYFNMNYSGVALNIELTHGFKEICDVLYN